MFLSDCYPRSAKKDSVVRATGCVSKVVQVNSDAGTVVLTLALELLQMFLEVYGWVDKGE